MSIPQQGCWPPALSASAFPRTPPSFRNNPYADRILTLIYHAIDRLSHCLLLRPLLLLRVKACRSNASLQWMCIPGQAEDCMGLAWEFDTRFGFSTGNEG